MLTIAVAQVIGLNLKRSNMKIKDRVEDGKFHDKRFTIKCSYDDIMFFYALCYRTNLGGNFDTPSNFMTEAEEVLGEDIHLDSPSISVEIAKPSLEVANLFSEPEYNIALNVL